MAAPAPPKGECHAQPLRPLRQPVPAQPPRPAHDRRSRRRPHRHLRRLLGPRRRGEEGEPRHVTSPFTSWSDDDLSFGAFDRTIDYVDPLRHLEHPGDLRVRLVDLAARRTRLRPDRARRVVERHHPRHSWVEVRVRGTSAGTMTKDYVLGRWAAKDPADGGGIHRTSRQRAGRHRGNRLHRHPRDPERLHPDRLAARGAPAATRRLGCGARRSTSSAPWPPPCPTPRRCRVSAAGPGRGIELAVPTYSQEVHIGHYPQWDNGGEAWCSPTSTAMVVGFWGAGPDG